MKQINENSGEFALWCDDRGMASPEELAKHPLTEEQKENLAIVCEKICEEFGLATEQQESPVSVLTVAKYILEKQGSMSTWELEIMEQGAVF